MKRNSPVLLAVVLGFALLLAGCVRSGCGPAVLPVADFRAVPDTIKVGEGVAFTDLTTAGTSGIRSWFWSFGDGKSSAAQNPIHTYVNASGSPYTVSLTVTTADGSNTRTRDRLIVVRRFRLWRG